MACLSEPQWCFVIGLLCWSWISHNKQHVEAYEYQNLMQTVRNRKHGLAQAVFGKGEDLLNLTWNIIKCWKEHFEELLNPTNTSSVEESEFEDSHISLAEVSEVVKKFLCSRVPCVDRIQCRMEVGHSACRMADWDGGPHF